MSSVDRSYGKKAGGVRDGAVIDILAVDSPDPRWPLLNRWSKPVSVVNPPTQAVVCHLVDRPSPTEPTRITPLVAGSEASRTLDPASNLIGPLTAKSPRSGSKPMANPVLDPKLISSALVAAPSIATVSGPAINPVTAVVPGSPAVPEGQVLGEPSSNLGVKSNDSWPSIPLGSPSVALTHALVAPATGPPPLKGAWANKLKLPISSDSQHPGKRFQQKIFPHESSHEDNERFPWAAKMDPAARNLFRATSPEYLEDGTPKVTIPSHVMLQGLENQKEYVLGQFYRCKPPPAGLVHAVVNKIWGRKCRIFIRKLDESRYLFHIPDASTREWVLQRGLWHVDDCLMFVAPWSTAETFDIPEISTIPVWVTLKNIPHRLYSIPGISHIASALGAPMATYKPRLDPSLMGEAKILVEVELSKEFPHRIAAADKKGNISMVNVEYSWVPSKCGDCGQLGHKSSRCMKPKLTQGIGTTSGSTGELAPTVVESEVQIEANVGFEIAPIPISGQCTRVAVCHKNDEAEVVTVAEDVTVAVVVTEAEVFNEAEVVTEEVTVTVTEAMGTLSPVIETTSTKVKSILSESEECNVIAGNRFSRLGSSFSDGDSIHSDGESLVSEDSYDDECLSSMTPSGQRILRERPVQPSIKAKEVQESSNARGGRNRGRGYRGRGQHGRGARGRG